MSLKSDETLQKMLLSTTSRFVGQFENDEVLLTHAWEGRSSQHTRSSFVESPVSRNGIVAIVRVEPVVPAAGAIVPDYSPTGTLFASYLAVFFGKRFDFHGIFEGHGMYGMPDLSQYSGFCNHKMPYNSHKVRNTFPVPLNLCYFLSLHDFLVENQENEKLVSIFATSSKFYLRALQTIESDAEMAYLHLITAGEILSGFFDYSREDLIDGELLAFLNAAGETDKHSKGLSSRVLSQLRSIRKSFVKTFVSLVDDKFFDTHEGDGGVRYFTKEGFESAIGAAYDLRSKYVHTGFTFSNWIQPDDRLDDLQFGEPVAKDKELSKILGSAPKFIGLERVVRYALLKLAERHGLVVKM